MSEVPVNVRCFNGEKFTTQVDLSSTIASFKQKISDQAGVSPELQRLIYKGRVMKEDGETLASYSVEENSTVHLVRTQARSTPAPAAASSSNPASTSSSGAGTSGTAGASPFAEMMNTMAGGGGMDINRMQQQLMSNPDMMASIMNSPMMEGLLNNPDMLRNIMFSNPQMQQVMQNNPQLAQVLNDPAMMRQYLDMARNPEAMQQARRSQDLMMSQIENQPGGFNALRRLYTDVQEPMMQASDNIVNGNNAASNASTQGGAQGAAPAPSAGPNTSALPNPWAPANSGTSAGNTGASNTSTGAAAANPWAGLGGGAGGLPGMGRMPGLGGQMDPAMMTEMMNNPMVQQMVSQMADDPALMETMIAQNPALQQAMQANPAIREQMPNLMRQMADPQNMQAIVQMQTAMQQLQRAGIMPPGGMGMPGMSGAGAGTGDGAGMASLGNFANLNLNPGGNASNAGGLDFSTLLGGGAGTNPWASTPPSSAQPAAPAPPATPANPEETYSAQLTQMNDMGFTDRAACIRALVASQGNVNAAVERLLGGGV